MLLLVDASLVVDNPAGQRLCETQVGQRYGRWKVSANTTNVSSPRLAGVTLRQELEASGWAYDDGWNGPPHEGRHLSECYPYTTIVGVERLGYDERPRYKRKPRTMPVAEFRPERAAACDELIRRVDGLRDADPPLLLRSHPGTAVLVDESSPHATGPTSTARTCSTPRSAPGRRRCGTGTAPAPARCWGRSAEADVPRRRSSRPAARSSGVRAETRSCHRTHRPTGTSGHRCQAQ